MRGGNAGREEGGGNKQRRWREQIGEERRPRACLNVHGCIIVYVQRMVRCTSWGRATAVILLA